LRRRKVRQADGPSFHMQGTVPAKGNAVWFDMRGEPHRILGFAIGTHDVFKTVSLPIVNNQYDLPYIDADIRLVRVFGFQSIFYEEVPMEDVIDNYDVYRKNVNCLESLNSYKGLVESTGIRIGN